MSANDHLLTVNKNNPAYDPHAADSGKGHGHSHSHGQHGHSHGPHKPHGSKRSLASGVSSCGQDIYNKDEREYIKEHFVHLRCIKYIEEKNDRCYCGRERDDHSREAQAKDEEATEWDIKLHTKAVPPSVFGRMRFHGFDEGAVDHSPYIRFAYRDSEADHHHTGDHLHTEAHDHPHHHTEDHDHPNHNGKPNRNSTHSDSTPIVHSESKPSLSLSTLKPRCTIDSILRLLLDHWNLKPPKLIISVTGGAADFYMKPKLLNSIKQGIVKAATSTDAWIITGGTNTGVMSFLGEAIKDHVTSSRATEDKMVLLGIAAWGVVDNKEALEGKEGIGKSCAHYNLSALHQEHVRGLAPLNHNHTHFLFVDDGTHRKFGAEIAFRAHFEQHISETLNMGLGRTEDVFVPVIQLVIEGGPGTVRTVTESAARGTPVLIIKDTGRAADLIAYAYELTRHCCPDATGRLNLTEDIHIKEQLLVCAEAMMDWSRVGETGKEKKKIECVDLIISLMENSRSVVSIYALGDKGSGDDIDHAILNAILKMARTSVSNQLNLALAFDRCDIARASVFSRENRPQWTKLNLSEAMFSALVDDKHEFVVLFLEHNLELSTFLTHEMLAKLYRRCLEESSPISELLDFLISKSEQSCTCTGCCACAQIETTTCTDRLTLYHIGVLISSLLGGQLTNFYINYDPKRQLSSTDCGSTKIDGLAENPEKHLFLWATLFNRRNLARIFWKNGVDNIGGALIGGALLKSLSFKASQKEELDLALDLKDHAMTFEGYAVGSLSECYQSDKDLAHQLLVRSSATWGDSTILQLANSGQHMDFMEHTCCQTKLNEIWNGRMSVNTTAFKIVLAFFIPVFILCIKFRDVKEVFVHHVHGKKQTYDALTTNMKSQDILPDSNEKIDRRTAHRCCYAFHRFYTAPVVKFFFNLVSSIVFMSLFSVFLLSDLHPLNEKGPSIMEYITMGWMVTLIMEEIRQIFTSPYNSLKYKVLHYFRNVWNVFDCIVYSLHTLSIILRFSIVGAEFHLARSCYSITLCAYFMRFLQTFYAEKHMGPKVIMIRRMLTDLLFFMAICLIFILSYGIAAHALSFPNHELNIHLIGEVLYKPYFRMYGELFLEDFEGGGEDCSHNHTQWLHSDHSDQCPEGSTLALILFVIYMIMTNVLLLNLLIAMFSYTFADVQDNSEKVWRFYRYALIDEYVHRPAIAPPIIIVNHVIRLITYCHRRRRQHVNRSDMIKDFDDATDSRLSAFERFGMKAHLRQHELLVKEELGFRVKSTGEKIEKVIDDLEHIREQVAPCSSVGVGSVVYESPVFTPFANKPFEWTGKPSPSRQRSTADGQRLTQLENKVATLDVKLDTIIKLINKEQS